MARFSIPILTIFVTILSSSLWAQDANQTQQIESIQGTIEHHEQLREIQKRELDRATAAEKIREEFRGDIRVETPEVQAPHDMDDSEFSEKE